MHDLRKPNYTVTCLLQRVHSGAESMSCLCHSATYMHGLRSPEIFNASSAHQALIAWGADPKQATAAWVTNHYKWIVWKLACYDRKFLQGSSIRTLTAENVLQQVKYR